MVTLSCRVRIAAAALAVTAIPTTALAADGDDRWKVPQCATLGVGAAFMEPIGYDERFADAKAGPVVEAGYGYCGSFVEASLRLRFVDTADFFLVQPGVLLRLHTRSPLGRGVEAGAGIRLGYNYLNVTSTGAPYAWSDPPLPMWKPYDAFGVVLGGGADVRYWLDSKWGFFLAADATWALAGQENGEEELALGSVTVTGGGVIRF